MLVKHIHVALFEENGKKDRIFLSQCVHDMAKLGSEFQCCHVPTTGKEPGTQTELHFPAGATFVLPNHKLVEQHFPFLQKGLLQ